MLCSLVKFLVLVVLVDRSGCYLGLRRRRSSCDAARGGWSAWSEYTACTCLASVAAKTRYRYCISPEPTCGGRECYGATSFTSSCLDLAEEGGWSSWSAWEGCESCSSNQYGTVETRERECDNPAPSCGGQGCEGASTESGPCDVDGRWEPWSEWGECVCSHDTGTGARARARTCTEPRCQGKQCAGGTGEQQPCDDQCCMTVQGSWGSWSDWDPCHCNYQSGAGTRGRSRTCTDPAPFCGGASCADGGTESGTCDDQCCQTLDGGWTEWTEWTSECACDHSTGHGVLERTRECTSPAPSCGGGACDGEGVERTVCSDLCCKLTDGSWGDWTSWSPSCLCDHTSGTGTRSQTRECDQPAPLCGGTSCAGDSIHLEACNEECCQSVAGGWGEWAPEGDCNCDHGAGTGVLQEKRLCDSPQPACFGSECEGNDHTRYRKCDDECCLTVAGGWSAYTAWTDCSCDHSSGTGTKTRSRECDTPPPSCFGRWCEGPATEPGTCDEACCTTVHGTWGPWDDWAGCACEGLQRTRERGCSEPEPECGGIDCEGPGSEILPCTEEDVCFCTFGEERCDPHVDGDTQANTDSDRCDNYEIRINEQCVKLFILIVVAVVVVLAFITVAVVCYIRRARRLNIPYKIDEDLNNTLGDTEGPVLQGALSLRTEDNLRRWDSAGSSGQCDGVRPSMSLDSPEHDNWYMGDPLEKLNTVPPDTVIINPIFVDPSLPDPPYHDPLSASAPPAPPYSTPRSRRRKPGRSEQQAPLPSPPPIPSSPPLTPPAMEEITIMVNGVNVQYHNNEAEYNDGPSVLSRSGDQGRPTSGLYQDVDADEVRPRVRSEHPYQDLDEARGRARSKHHYDEVTVRDRVRSEHPYHDIQGVMRERGRSPSPGYVEMGNEEGPGDGYVDMNSEQDEGLNEGAAGYVRSGSTGSGYVKMTSETHEDNIPPADYVPADYVRSGYVEMSLEEDPGYVNDEPGPDPGYVRAGSTSGYVEMSHPTSAGHDQEGFVEEATVIANPFVDDDCEDDDHIYYEPGAL